MNRKIIRIGEFLAFEYLLPDGSKEIMGSRFFKKDGEWFEKVGKSAYPIKNSLDCIKAFIDFERKEKLSKLLSNP